MAEAFLPNIQMSDSGGSGLSFDLIKTLSGANGSISYTPDPAYAFLIIDSYLTGSWKFSSGYGCKCGFCLDWGSDTYNHTGALVTCIANNYNDSGTTYFYFNSTTYLGRTLVMMSNCDIISAASSSGTSVTSSNTRTPVASWHRSNYSYGGQFTISGYNDSYLTTAGSLQINIYGCKFNLPS